MWLTRLCRSRAITVFGLAFSLVVLSENYAANAQSDTPIGWEDSSEATFEHWITVFSVPPGAGGINVAQINQSFVAEGEKEFILNLTPGGINFNSNSLFGLNISGSVQLSSDVSLVRVLLVDTASHEHLVYEAYPLIVQNRSFAIAGVCEETCFLDGTSVSALRIQLIKGSIQLEEISYLTSAVPLQAGMPAVQQQIKQSQNAIRISQIQQQIHDKGLKWVAGETSISSLPFEL
jgi:hypothetical protein